MNFTKKRQILLLEIVLWCAMETQDLFLALFLVFFISMTATEVVMIKDMPWTPKADLFWPNGSPEDYTV